MNELHVHRIQQTTLLIAHFAVALALNTSMPLLPILKSTLGLSVLETSVLPTLLTVSTAIANLLAGFLIAHIGQKRLLMGGFLLMIGGTILLALATSFMGIAIAFFVMGIGIGWLFTALTTMFSGLPAEMQNFGIYHSLFGMGGFLAPIILNQTLRSGLSYRWLFAAYAAMLFLLFLTFFLNRSIENIRYPGASFRGMIAVLAGPLVSVSLLAFAAYAAVEIGTSNLSGIMSVDFYGLNEISAGYILSGFWLAFSISRFFSEHLAKRFGGLRFLALCGVMSLGVVILWSVEAGAWMYVLAGLTFGPVFPVLQKWVNRQLEPEKRGLFNGMTYAFTGLGATITLPIMGRLGDIRMSYAFIPSLVLIILFSVLLLFLDRLARKT
jgi:fucose permease